MFDVEILVDHSCGHDRQRDDSLNLVRMNVRCGGKQAKMHDSKIKMERGYLIKNNHLLSVGDTQEINWKKGDRSPIFMDIDEWQLLISGNDIIGTTFKMLPLTKVRKLIKNPMYFESLTYANKKERLALPLKVLRKVCILNEENCKEKKNFSV